MEGKGKRAARAPGETEPAAEAAETAPEAAAPMAALPSPAALPRPRRAAAEFGDLPAEALAAMAESQAAVARGLDALSVEAAGLARRGIDAAAQSAKEMLAAKTFADAVAVNAGLARRSFETLVAGSARLSELGVRLASDAAEPLLTQFGRSWVRAARFGG